MPELQLSILWEDSFLQQSNFCGPLVILPSLLNIVTCQPLEYWRPKEATTTTSGAGAAISNLIEAGPRTTTTSSRLEYYPDYQQPFSFHANPASHPRPQKSTQTFSLSISNGFRRIFPFIHQNVGARTQGRCLYWVNMSSVVAIKWWWCRSSSPFLFLG